MDVNRIRKLAGVSLTESIDFEDDFLTEVVDLSGPLTIEDLIGRLDACKRALSIASKFKDPADRKKWVSKVFVNLNKVRGALTRLINSLDVAAS
jgi:hypothetical protein